jgi:hypothetical protein
LRARPEEDAADDRGVRGVAVAVRVGVETFIAFECWFAT